MIGFLGSGLFSQKASPVAIITGVKELFYEIKMDNGSESKNHLWEDFCFNKNIKHIFSSPITRKLMGW